MKNKGSRARMQVIFGSLLFVVDFIAEMYVIIKFPNQFLAIVAIGLLGLVCAYLVIDGVFVMQGESETKRNEQSECIYKSEKAAFLVSRKNFDRLEKRLDELEQTLGLPTEEIINAQKGIAKVSINRSRENVEALMNSNDLVIEQLRGLGDRMDELSQSVVESRRVTDVGGEAVEAVVSAGRDAVIESQKRIGKQNEKALQMQVQELMVGMKDMELRLNQAIMQIQKVQPQAIYMEPMQKEISFDTISSGKKDSTLDKVFTDAENALAGAIDELPEDDLNPAELPQTEAVLENTLPENDLNSAELPQTEAVFENTLSEAEPLQDMTELVESVTKPELAAEQKEEVLPEAELAAEPERIVDQEVISDPEVELSVDPVSSIDLNMESDTKMPVVPEELQMESDNELPSIPDLSDPNKPLSLDEIDALFANMGVETTKPAEEPKEPEPMFEPDLIIGSELISEPAEQMAEDVPVIEEIKEPTSSEKEPKDSNKTLSFSEIDALFASMGIGDAEEIESVEEPVPEPKIQEEKPKMPDLSDPNKAMSPEDIAALIANMA